MHHAYATLIDYVENKLATEPRAQLEEHLAGPCAECDARLEHLRMIVDTLEQGDLAAPPADVLQRAIAAFRKPAPPPRVPALRILADLVFNSRLQPSPVYARGALQAQQVLYAADGLDIDLQVTPYQSNAMLVGQILVAEKDQPTSAFVSLYHAGEILDGAATDAFGQFAFRRIPHGMYDLIIEAETREIAIEGLKVGND